MPIASWILLCAILGHTGGAADTLTITLLTGSALLAVLQRVRRGGRTATIAAVVLFAGGWIRAAADRWSDARCRGELVRAPAIEFVTEFDLAAGESGPARATSMATRCSLDVGLRARTALRGGRWYRTDSRPEPAGRALLVTVRTVHPTSRRAVRQSIRADAVQRVDSIFRRDAPMARALLLADMHLVSPDLRLRWSRAGLVHLLSVSGVHVAIVAGALLLLANAARLAERRAILLALALTSVYVVILGLPAPAVRAAVMFGAVLVARLRQRPASKWSILVLGALLPVLVDPAAPLDLGWQLSVLGVASLAASGSLSRRLAWQGTAWHSRIRREVLASTVASIASAPLVAWHFGTVSLIAPAANLVAAPVISVLQPTLFLALVAAPSLPVARFIAGAAHPMLAFVDGVAEASSAPSWAALSVAPSLAECCIGAALVCALLAAMVMRDAAVPLSAAGGCLVLLLLREAVPGGGSGLLEMHVLDVGQGDAVALRTPGGQWILVDAGGGPPGVDQGRRTVLPYLRRHGGRLEAFILSHPHLDHVGGAPAVIGALRPARYVDAAFVGGTEAYRASLESAAVHRVRWNRVHPGDSLRLDGVLFRFLAPDSVWTSGLDDANLASTVVRVEFGSIAFLLVGDAEAEEEEWLLANTPAPWLAADVLKVGHHGSRTSSTAGFLDVVRPRLAVVSVGRHNRYGHPSPDVLEEFNRRRIPVLRTDDAGTTVVRTDGRTISISTTARQWSLPLLTAVPRSASDSFAH